MESARGECGEKISSSLPSLTLLVRQQTSLLTHWACRVKNLRLFIRWATATEHKKASHFMLLGIKTFSYFYSALLWQIRSLCMREMLHLSRFPPFFPPTRLKQFCGSSNENFFLSFFCENFSSFLFKFLTRKIVLQTTNEIFSSLCVS